MTKKEELELQHEVRKDALNHDLRVGDTVIFHWWDRRVKWGIVKRFTPKWVQISVPSKADSTSEWIENRHADRVIKGKARCNTRELKLKQSLAQKRSLYSTL